MPLPNRQSIRLQNYDYAAGGMYFVTICTHQKKCLFGRILNYKMIPTPLGQLVTKHWFQTSELRANVFLSEFTLMPNHLHGIIIHNNDDSLTGQNALSAIIRGFKASVTKQASSQNLILKPPLWQRNYYEHIIRNQWDLERVSNYMANNPANWENDSNYTAPPPPKKTQTQKRPVWETLAFLRRMNIGSIQRVSRSMFVLNDLTWE